MRALGLNVDKGTLRWVLVDGTLSAPTVVSGGRMPHDPGQGLAARMTWFRDRFDALIGEHAPDRIAYRMHMGRAMTQEQVGTFHYPWGVLLLCCAGPGIEPIELTGSSLTAKRFGLPKGAKPMIEVDTVLGRHPPHWDDAQRYAACAAWGSLP